MYFTLQGEANENGSYAIDAAELSRVYALRDTGGDTAAMELQAIAYDAETLRAQVELLQIQVEIMCETTQDLRANMRQKDITEPPPIFAQGVNFATVFRSIKNNGL